MSSVAMLETASPTDGARETGERTPQSGAVLGVLAATLLALAACHQLSYPITPPSVAPDGGGTAPQGKFKGGVNLYSQGDAMGLSSAIAVFDTSPSYTTVPVYQGACAAIENSVSQHPVSAGTIYLGGTLAPMVLTPANDRHYPTLTTSGPLWTGGEQLSVHGDGGEILPFKVSVTAPAQVQVTSGLSATTTTIAHGQDLVLQVNGPPAPTGAMFTVWMLSPTTIIECKFLAVSGAAVIPAAALSALPIGRVNLWVGTSAESDAFVGEWDISLIASIPAVDAFGGSMRFIQATFN
jgi:hypothetical protein